MAPRRRGARVLGPYRNGHRWHVLQVGSTGTRKLETFGDADEAEEFAKEARRTLPGEMTLGRALEMYRTHLETEGNRGFALKPVSVVTTLHRIRNLLTDPIQELSRVSREQLYKTYTARVGIVSADTHRNELNEVKTFFRWAVEVGAVRANPAEGIKPQGRRLKGIESKVQLRVQEAERFKARAVELALAGSTGALAAAILLDTGIRASELLERKARDLDQAAGKDFLAIDRGKTRAAQRYVTLDHALAELLRARLRGRPGDSWMWPNADGHRDRSWLHREVEMVCLSAGVPVVCPHGLRGTKSSLERLAGRDVRDISRDMGHEDERITREAYIDPQAETTARHADWLRVLEGGAK